ncbi:MAG: ABC transporter permease [Elusimicrobia bacterium]|nr:ABC transporter permease [Elusimicrobiota bacterium]
MSLIEIKGITRSYQVGGSELKVLKGIDLTIEEGEFVAIMGPSGSGKSTLMQILGLLDRPTSGQYHLLGRDVSRLSDDEGAILRSRTIGFIFQMFNLLARTSALDNVALPMIYSGAPNREERALDVLKQVGLQDRIHHKPNELSGGQQQRVAVARSLVNHPKIIFADEPTGNLASDQAEDILNQPKLLNRGGITIIMVTHEPDIAAHAKRIIRIKDGMVVADELTADGEKDCSGGGGVALAKAATKLGSEMKVDLSHPELSFSEIREFSASALRALGANKVRSALSMLGILIGVGAVIAMMAIGKGAQKSIEARLASLGSNLVMMIPGSTSVGGVRGGSGSRSRFTLEDVKAISKVRHVARVEGTVGGSGQMVYKDQNWNTQLTGATSLYAAMHNAQPYYGRFFTDEEDLHLDRVVLLGQSVVNNLYPKGENPVGTIVKINHINFEVIGILPIKGSTGFRDQDDMAIIPLRTAMKRVVGKVYVDNISIEADGPESITPVIADVQRLMRRRHHLPDYKDDDFTLRNMADIQAALSGTTQTFTLLLGIVAAISLLVGGIGIMNIMLVSVSERTREIGLRKAVGAARRAILSQFLIESAVLSTMGGVIGIVMGMTVSFTLSQFAGWAAVVTPQSVLMAFLFSATVGVIFGFWPARKASLLSPIEALRYE